MKKKIKFILIITILSFLVVGVLYIYNRWPEPPVKELQMASDVLTLTRQVDAYKYAPELFNRTTQLYDSAMNHWKKENEKFILNRNFIKTRIFALEAVYSGKNAYFTSIKKAESMNLNADITIANFERIRKNFEKRYRNLPLNDSILNNFNLSITLISEAKLAKERLDLILAESKLKQAEVLLIDSNKKAISFLKNYFESFSKWEIQVKNAIEQSDIKNSFVIIVDKMAHECLLYQNGILINKFNAEFGPNWIGTKLYKGDQATPEGDYTIISKKYINGTIYYKALLINYPNTEDRIRYLENVESGKISDVGIGSSIEIHGKGGLGFNWTSGCVALTNEDMDIIYKVPKNTPVIIVGSIKPIEEYI